MAKPFNFRRIALIGLAVIAIMLLGLFSQLENWRRDLTINHASLDADAVDPHLRPPVVDQPIPQVAAKITDWAESQDHWSVESNETSASEAKIHLTRTTKVFRWVDDIHVRLSQTDGGVRVDAKSQSRVGKADFGQNPRNLRELIEGIKFD